MVVCIAVFFGKSRGRHKSFPVEFKIVLHCIHYTERVLFFRKNDGGAVDKSQRDAGIRMHTNLQIGEWVVKHEFVRTYGQKMRRKAHFLFHRRVRKS